MHRYQISLLPSPAAEGEALARRVRGSGSAKIQKGVSGWDCNVLSGGCGKA